MLDTRVVSEPHVLIFEPFSLDVSRSELMRGDDVVQLRRQSFDVLRYLAQAGGRLVSNDEIVDAVWSVRPAQPNDSVTQCIKDIRRAMGDDARWMIRTVSGKGYEFKAPVRVAPSKSGPTVAEEPPAKAPSGEAEAITTNVDHHPPGSLRVASPHRWLAWATSPYARTAAVAAAVLSVLLLTSLGLIWRNVQAANGGTLTMMAVPTLAVQPLEVIGEEHKSFAGRLGEQITQQLSKSPGGFELSVRAMKPSDGASRLHPTRYGLRGVVTATEGRREVVVHLIEAQSNRQVWANSFSVQEDSDIGRVASQAISAFAAAAHLPTSCSRTAPSLPLRPITVGTR